MQMNKTLLLFTLEYKGYHSVRGTALSKRSYQIATSFSENNWKVIVIHKDQVGECGNKPFLINQLDNGITRIAVSTPADLHDYNGNQIIRRLKTLFYTVFFGDRSYLWAKEVIKHFNEFGIETKPDNIIGIFTPRAPLFLGNYFSKKLNVPWVADLQDDILIGISKKNEPFAKKWAAKILKTAKNVIHASPEWALSDGEIIGRQIKTIRHGIPIAKFDYSKIKEPELIMLNKGTFNVFYGGSLTQSTQSLDTLKSIIDFGETINRPIRIFVAGNINALNSIRNTIPAENLVYLGWLSSEDMLNYICNCDCTLVIPWSKSRIGIPSKFYEYCGYPKPIWVIGNDLGAFKTLLNEWQHPQIPMGEVEYQRKTYLCALNGDMRYMFNLGNCKGKYLLEKDLYNEFIKYM